MKKQKSVQKQFSQAEVQLIEQLRQQPEMMKRVQSILALTTDAKGPLKTADEVEEELIQEMRQLGNTSMNQWAIRAEERVSHELKAQDATICSRKKKR
jgi:hypothetical protein